MHAALRAPIRLLSRKFIALWKGKKDIKDGRVRLGILCADGLAKAHAKIVRRRLLPFYKQYTLDTQVEGLPGGSPQCCGVYEGLILQRAKNERCSIALLFTDVVSAFYSVLRETVFWCSSDEELVRVAERAGFSPEAWTEMVKWRSRVGSSLAEAAVPAPLQDLLRELHGCAWVFFKRM